MILHPHVHCVVTGGGLSADGTRWTPCRAGYFLPVRVLGKLFRGKFLDALHRAWRKGELELDGSTAELEDPVAWTALKARLYRRDWVVYAKPPFGGPEQVFRYLGRYTHRVAISNHRIESYDDARVTFAYKDYADGGHRKTMTLTASEFLRRFLLHVLPKGFVRIRHYGLYAGRNVTTRLAIAGRLLEPERLVEEPEPALSKATMRQPWWERFRQRTGIDVMACPCCRGQLVIRQSLPAFALPAVFCAPARAPPEAM